MREPVQLSLTTRGAGAPLLLLHGLYGSGGNLNRFTRRFAADYRVLTPDLRNHGRSPHRPGMEYPALAADVEALLDREGVERVAVLGHSMGGKVAMTLALTRPRRVAAVVAADIAPVAYRHEHATVIAALQRVDVAGAASRREVDAALAAEITSPAVRQFLLTNLVPAAGGGYQWRIPLQLLAEAVPDIQGFPDLAGTYDGPALFLYGTASDYFDPVRHRDAAAGYFPAAEFEALEGAGHWLHAEQPEAFAAAVERFLARTYPAR
ncbi:alpha/beta fold hydrolase [Halorhodospira sp. 9621]|uniref:alpha/beta fold hydrolase n=1 Tax=Halorhodospira TaxID=85108 RepID=UPI001EE9275C|nr:MULTISPECIES: alpha/beta fold hydrolase [Halorhodospira]MCG5526938.1 alpha/beta fold hydrolase [Halorhodospira halophila]MCG5534141.1 alpha/beta fold hydrolase [Halorhodospira sp. 9621]MCG5542725.1 alpha/beta fold hydrolase [Halorhodospira sp. 9628]